PARSCRALRPAVETRQRPLPPHTRRHAELVSASIAPHRPMLAQARRTPAAPSLHCATAFFRDAAPCDKHKGDDAMAWMLLPYRRYFDFSGRSRRKEYWMFTLLQVIIGVILTALIFMDGGFRLDAFGQPDFSGGFGPLFWIGAGLGTIWALGTIIPSIAVTVRRLHDRNLTGWIYLGIVVLQFVPVVDIL